MRCAYMRKKVRKDKETYEAELLEADARYLADLKQFQSMCKRYSFMIDASNEPRKRYVSKFTYVDVPTDFDEIERKLLDDYKSWSYDKWSCTGKSTGFKNHAARHVRRAGKRFCASPEAWETEPYPTYHLGDKFVWSYW